MPRSSHVLVVITALVFTFGCLNLAHAAPPAKLKALVKAGGWKKPAKNAKGQWQIVHVKTGLPFVYIPKGKFQMGSEAGGSDEKPLRTVTIKPFLLCASEVPLKVWKKLGGTLYPSIRPAGKADWPIHQVTFNEAAAWTKSHGLRLPSEAEWEYACRAGGPAKPPADLDKVAWYSKNSKGDFHPTGKKQPNTWGLFDMLGNAHEWTQDKYEGYGKAPKDGSAMAGDAKAMRVYRGGYKSTSKGSVTCSYRNRSNPMSRYQAPGVRPAASLP